MTAQLQGDFAAKMTSDAVVVPNRSDSLRTRPWKFSDSSIAATTVRIEGGGSSRLSQFSSDAASPAFRLQNTAIFTSRQPVSVFTLPASIAISIAPDAVSNRLSSSRWSRVAVARRAVACVSLRMFADGIVIQVPTTQLPKSHLSPSKRIPRASERSHPLSSSRERTINAQRRVSGETTTIGVDDVLAFETNPSEGGQEPAFVLSFVAGSGKFFSSPWRVLVTEERWRACLGEVCVLA